MMDALMSVKLKINLNVEKILTGLYVHIMVVLILLLFQLRES